MITVKLQGDEAVRAALLRLSKTMDDMTPAMQEIGEYLVDSTRRRFLRGVSPQGAPWAPKSEATPRAVRRRAGNHHRPLLSRSETSRRARALFPAAAGTGRRSG